MYKKLLATRIMRTTNTLNTPENINSEIFEKSIYKLQKEKHSHFGGNIIHTRIKHKTH